MILFIEDWAKYPTAMPDYDTTNRSFVELAALYKSMGIENHLFHLALVNQQLKGVDPFSTELSQAQELMIAIECHINPWYYFREIARVPAQGGDGADQLQGNRGNIALYWCFFNHATTFLIQIRQTGKSLAVSELVTYLLNIRCKDTDINLLTKDETLRQNDVKRLKDIEAELPAYLKQRTRSDTSNTQEIGIKSRNNRYLTHVPQGSLKAANNQGRGLSSPILLVDEGPFQRYIGTSLPAAFAAATALREKAAKAGEPYGNILTTTAGKKDDPDGAFIYNILQMAFPWTEKLFDCKNWDDFKAMVCNNSGFDEIPYINITLNHLQVGKDDAWLKRTLQNTPGITPEAADRDFFNRWTSGSQSSPLSVELLEALRKGERDPSYIEIGKINNYVTRWYIPEHEINHRMANGHYVMSLDTSDAAGGDEISLHIKDSRTGEVIAAGNYNETNIIKFSEWIATWFERFPNFTAIIERRSTGAAVIDNLLLLLPSMGIDPFKRIYNRIVQESDANPERFKEIQIPLGRRPPEIYVKHKKAFGFSTSGSGLYARNELYSTTLQNAAKQVGGFVKDKKTINQITSLEIRNGRVDHAEGGHDDMVIAWLLGHWLITQGRNLTFYGFDRTNILSAIRTAKELSPADAFMAQRQKQLKQEVDELVEKLSNEKDDLIVYKIEHRLKHLNSQLSFEEQELFSIEELIKKTKDQKRENIAKRAATHYGFGVPQNQHDRYQQQIRAAYSYRDPNYFRL